MDRDSPRGAGGVIRIGIFGNLETVTGTVAVTVDHQRVCAGVIGINKCPSAGLDAVQKTIAIGIWVCRVGSSGLLLPVIGTIFIGIWGSRVGAVNILLGIVYAVLVEVARTELGQIPRKELLLVSVGNIVPVGVEAWVKAV